MLKEELMQKIREEVLLHRDKIYQYNEDEVRKRWQYEESVSFLKICLKYNNDLFFLLLFLMHLLDAPPQKNLLCLLSSSSRSSGRTSTSSLLTVFNSEPGILTWTGRSLN